MQKIHLSSALVMISLSLVLSCCKPQNDKIVIGYVQITSDPVLDLAKESLFKVLADSGYVNGQNINILDQNAQGDLSMLPTIFQSFVSAQVDVIITNGTPCMQAAAQLVKDIPVVFTVSFGPRQIGIQDVPGNLFGVYDSLEVGKIVDLLQKCIPDLHRVGVPFNNSEPNAVYAQRVFAEEFGRRSIEVEAVSINSANDLLLAGQALAQKNINLFFISADNTVYLGLNALSNVANDAKIPIIVTDPLQINKGAALGYGVNYSLWGHMTGQKVVDLFKGRGAGPPNIIPIRQYELTISKKACAAQGLVVPDEILQQADNLIE
ncbi:MAG: ABC transporter substrate-binding protein [Bacteroidales bacterium]